MSLRAFRSITVAALLTTVILACKETRVAPPTPSTAATGTRSVLRAAELPISYSAVTHIAYAKGYLKEEGLDYRVISVPAGPDMISALRAGGGTTVDIGTIAVTPIITLIGAGDHPVVVATCIESDSRVQLVTFSNSGITSDPVTLKDKKVGYVASTVGEIYLSRLLRKAGLQDKDVRAVNGRPADLKSLLVQGDLDAAVLWDPFVSQAEREGRARMKEDSRWSRGEPRVYVDPTIYHMTFNVVAMKNKYDSVKGDLERFLKACIRAGEFIESNPDEARRILEKWLELQDGDLKNFIETTSFRVHLDVPQMRRDMKSELEWLKERQPKTIIPADLGQYLDTSLLAKIDPARVRAATDEPPRP